MAEPAKQEEKAPPKQADAEEAAERSEFDRFRDLPIQASVHLDRRRLPVHELLGLERNSVIRLERAAGEDVDLLLNGVLAGRGEIVVLDERMGLRITVIEETAR